MRHKLVTLPKSTTRIPRITVGTSTIILRNGEISTISPNTANFAGGNSTLGYTAILSNSDVANISVSTPIQNSVLPTTPRFIGDNEDARSVAVTGIDFVVTAKQLTTRQTATITIIGNETGGSTTINLTVNAFTTTSGS